MASIKKVEQCGQCPFFECYLYEHEDGLGCIGKGRCHKWDKDEIWETRTPCGFAEENAIEDLERLSLDDKPDFCD